MTEVAIQKMNQKLADTATARFCPLQALKNGNRLKVVKHTFEGKADPSAVLVQVDSKGKILTPLDGLSSAKEIGFRTPILKCTRVFAALKQLCKQVDDHRNPTQMVEVVAPDELSAKALALLNPLPAWQASVYANGFCMGKDGKGDPRKKTTDGKRKLKEKDFADWFQEIIEAQGAPYASAWSKFDDTKAVTFRSKVLERVWDALESTESPYDDVTPRVEDIHKTQMHRTKLAPIRLFYQNKLVQPEDYDSTISCTDLCYITGSMKIVHSRYA